jgi:hypothetical protein
MNQKQREVSPAGSGDERTPDKRIGEVAYADKSVKTDGNPKTAPDTASKPAAKAAQKSSLEGPAAYAPHDDGEKIVDPPKGGRR